MPKRKLLLISEAAKYLGVPAPTLKFWVKKGRIKSHKTPGNWNLFDLEELDAFKEVLRLQRENL